MRVEPHAAGAEPDDESLSWAGPADPTHLDAPASDGVASNEGIERSQQTGSVLLVVYGVFVGVYLLFTIGWMIAALRNTGGVDTAFGQIMYSFGEFLAIAAPALWLVTGFYLTRTSRSALRVLWLLIGALVLVPWPFVFGM